MGKAKNNKGGRQSKLRQWPKEGVDGEGGGSHTLITESENAIENPMEDI